MKRNKILLSIAVFLIALGAFSILYEQISYVRHEKIIDIGPLEATIERETHCVRLPVFFGISVILSGICIFFLEIKKKPQIK
ncbi:MAG: hypothetical protein WCT85_03360 [Parachlamydiales bacterium]